MPLNSQEKRDAWPGNFTDYILKVGGKPAVAKYPGHDFFPRVMKAKGTDRGNFRLLAAQMAMLFMTRREFGADRICDTNRDAIDTFYYKNLSFDPHGADGKRFREILDLLTNLLGDGKRPKVIGHEAIHLVLLVDSLLDDYTRTWLATLPNAFDHFKNELAKAKATRYDVAPSEYWVKYGQLTRANSDRSDTIARRHQFFVEKLHKELHLELKDPVRIFGEIERQMIYFRDKKRCQVCDSDVVWNDHEIHHVIEHSKGGPTTARNGALVHKACHPKGERATSDFVERWRSKILADESRAD
jgi:hypothetical protein